MCTEYNVRGIKDFLLLLEAIVNIDTPSGDSLAINRAVSLLEKTMAEAGSEVFRIPSERGDILHSKVGHGKNKILFLGHIDTVFPFGETERRPFAMDGTHLFGPGILDMKSGLCMTAEIFRHFSRSLSPEWELNALFTCDEEIGSGKSRETIYEMLKDSQYCFCMEPAHPGQCILKRKGITAFLLKAFGVTAHSGVNYKDGHSAIEALCRCISEIYDLRDDRKNISINFGKISGGTGKNNIVSDYAEASGEFRCFDTQTKNQILKKINDITGREIVSDTHIDLSIVGSRPPMAETEESEALFRILQDKAKSHGLELHSSSRGGGSDAAFAAELGIPVLDGLGAEGEGSHTEAETVYLPTLYPKIYSIIDTVSELTKNS